MAGNGPLNFFLLLCFLFLCSHLLLNSMLFFVSFLDIPKNFLYLFLSRLKIIKTDLVVKSRIICTCQKVEKYKYGRQKWTIIWINFFLQKWPSKSFSKKITISLFWFLKKSSTTTHGKSWVDREAKIYKFFPLLKDCANNLMLKIIRLYFWFVTGLFVRSWGN